ncbi:hypothetical protein IW261DRAFT_1570952 [Armillaria novae-zelandiae]|uniref:Uncharacterized protein n=1 Tax=Armillaria novae-zelandiae TaxID=153914 RepID=A0AA39NUZ8_9AGAR|nr:hypothetical protein IW261DRAFT_1570952 [Armillaria novae-zelandiae]
MSLAGVLSLSDGVASWEGFKGMNFGHMLAYGSACEAAGRHNRRGSRFRCQGSLHAHF